MMQVRKLCLLFLEDMLKVVQQLTFKSVKNHVGVSWDWFKSPEPMGHPWEHF